MAAPGLMALSPGKGRSTLTRPSMATPAMLHVERIDGETTDHFTVRIGDETSLTTKSILGEGGFATVYLAHDVEGDGYALKVTKPLKESDRMRLIDEVKILNNFAWHNNVVRYHCAGMLEDRAYVVMERCVSLTLHDLIRARPLMPDELLWIGHQLVCTVQDIHSRGCIHRDIKLQNLLFDFNGNLKVSDFGLASRINEDAPRKTVAGTALYMAPEMAEHYLHLTRTRGQDRADVRQLQYGREIDVWSIGVALYIMMTRAPPYWSVLNAQKHMDAQQRNQHLFNAVATAEWSWPDNFTGDLGMMQLVERVMAKDKASRATLEDIVEDPVWDRRPISCPLSLVQELKIVETGSTPARRGLSEHPSPNSSTVVNPKGLMSIRKKTVEEFIQHSAEEILAREEESRDLIATARNTFARFWYGVFYDLEDEIIERMALRRAEEKAALVLFTMARQYPAPRRSAPSSRAASRTSVSAAPRASRQPARRSVRASSVALIGEEVQPTSSPISPSDPSGARRAGSLIRTPGREVSVTVPADFSLEEDDMRCLNQHLMRRVKQMPRGYVAFDCNLCEAAFCKLTSERFMFRCDKCDFDVCMRCVKRASTVEADFMCDKCNKKFLTEAKLKTHYPRCRGVSSSPARAYDNAAAMTMPFDRHSTQVPEPPRTASTSSRQPSRQPSRQASSARGRSRSAQAMNLDMDIELGLESPQPTTGRGSSKRGRSLVGVPSPRSAVRISRDSVGSRISTGPSVAEPEDPDDIPMLRGRAVVTRRSATLPERRLEDSEVGRLSSGYDLPPPEDEVVPRRRGGYKAQLIEEDSPVTKQPRSESNARRRRSASNATLGVNSASSSAARPLSRAGTPTGLVHPSVPSMAAAGPVVAPKPGHPAGSMSAPTSAATSRQPSASMAGQRPPHIAPADRLHDPGYVSSGQVAYAPVTGAAPAMPLQQPGGAYAAPVQAPAAFAGQVMHPAASAPLSAGGPSVAQFAAPAAVNMAAPEMGMQMQVPAPALAPGTITSAGAQGQGPFPTEPLSRPAAFMALPKHEHHRAEFTEQFLSGAWVRHYVFCSDCNPVMFYSLQPGRFGALYAHDMKDTRKGFGTVVLDIHSNMVLHVKSLASESADRGEAHPHVQTFYHDDLAVITMQEAARDPHLNTVLDAIVTYVNEMVRMQQDNMPPAYVPAAYVHQPDAQSVSRDTKFAYLRKVFPDPNHTFTMLRLSNMRTQVICTMATMDIRWQADQRNNLALKYYVHSDGTAEPFANDRTGVCARVEHVLTTCYGAR